MKQYFGLIILAAALLSPDANAAAQGRGGLRGQGPFGDPDQLPPGGRGRIGAPTRDNASAPQGTARIAGRIVSAETGSPIRRAQVRVTAAEARVNRVSTTDSEGRYELTGLAAGRYRLAISKAGYVTLEYGQARPFEAGKQLDLADGQTLDKIDFSLPRGSVITGRVTDEFGDPIADAQVQAMRYRFANGERQLVSAGRTAMSDDIGQFRIFGLMPGDYIIRAAVRENNVMALAAMRGIDTADADERSGYPSTYYPGTTDVGQAQTVTVALGQELASVAFSLVPTRLARISGTVLASDGRPLAAMVVVRPATGGGALGPLNLGGGNQSRADGTFTLNSVPPGDYSLEVQQRPQSMQNPQTGQLEFASVPLSVAGGDISGLTIITTPGVSVSGRILFQGDNAQKASAKGAQVIALAPGGISSIIGIAGRALGGGRVNTDDGAFQLRGLLGPQMIRATGLPSGWALRSISLEGEDITDEPFDFKPGGNLTGLVITLTDKITDLSGAVKDDQGQPAKDYVLVVFPDDPKLWSGQSRHVRTARPNQDGNFNIKGLPPARYYAIAIESLETGTQNDPALLEHLRPRAKAFTLAEDQSLTLDLTIAMQ